MALLSVRYYQFHLHATYTPHILPHGTSTGGRYHSIGEQKSLSLRKIVLRPYGVKPTAYVQIDCEATGVERVRCVQGSVRYFGIILHS